MADESYTTKAKESLLLNISMALAISMGWTFRGKLSVGGNTAIAGDWVTRQGEVTAGTPATHNDYDLAISTDAVNFRPAGIILEPDPLPDGWGPDDALVDGTWFIGLVAGCGALIRTKYADASDDVLPDQILVPSTTAGKLAKLSIIPATTTQTNAEIIAAFKALSRALLQVTSVAEDVGGTGLIVEGRMI